MSDMIDPFAYRPGIPVEGAAKVLPNGAPLRLTARDFFVFPRHGRTGSE
jgi:hypothetical protein